MKITNYKIILGSTSPRRKEILSKMGISFKIRNSKLKERYPLHLKGKEISEYLAEQKSENIFKTLVEGEILITADTIVLQNNNILNKPTSINESIKTLKLISGDSHKVITSVCLRSITKKEIFSEITTVYFANISKKMREYYIKKYHPFDKSGSYGIQEWIGLVAIDKIIGSYTNVMGLPSARLFNEIRKF